MEGTLFQSAALKRVLTFGVVVCIFNWCSISFAEWHVFRGPSGGSSPTSIIENDANGLQIKWATPIPGRGHSTPVFSEGLLYVTTAKETRSSFLRLFQCGFWLSNAAATGMMLIFLRKTISSNTFRFVTVFRDETVFIVLLLLVMFGFHLLECQRDTLRRWVYSAIVTSICLLCVQILVTPSRRNNLCLGIIGILFSLWCFYQFPAWEWMASYKRKILPIIIMISLMPFGVLLHTLVPETTFCRKKHLRLVSGILPLLFIGYLFHLARTGQNKNVFWKVQPVHALVLPEWYLPTIGIVASVVTLLLVAGVRFQKFRRIGEILLCFVATAGLGIVLPWVVNRYNYLKYHLVRGEWGSPLGWMGCIVIGLVITGGIIVFTTARYWKKPEENRNCGPVVPTTLALLCAAGVWLSSGTTLNMLSALKGTIIAVNAEDGSLRWITDGLPIATTTTNDFNTAATPSPAINEELVCGYFGANGLFACRKTTGDIIWTYTDITHESGYGPASSLLAVGGGSPCFIVQNDNYHESSQVIALSYVNGRPVWMDSRPAIPTWRSPILCRWQSQTVICAWGDRHLDFYDTGTGKQLHRIHNIYLGPGDAVSSPVYYEGTVYLVGSEWLIGISLDEVFKRGYGQSCLSGNEDRRDDDKTPIIYPTLKIDLGDDGPTCASSACRNGRLLCVSDMGVVSCIDLANKNIIWKQELDETLASPFIAGDYGCVVTRKGTVHIFDMTHDSYHQVETLDLNEEVFASPIAYKDRLFIRTVQRLVCLQAR